MESLYEKNGLIFWTQEEIKLRRMFEDYFSSEILASLRKQNAAFQMLQVEAPLLTPRELINKGYTDEDIWAFEELVLRPETTMGSFAYAKHILSGYHEIKQKPPVIIFQHGKSFRRERDMPTERMRLKEFYQLEFQIIFSATTANDYSTKLYPDVLKMISNMIGSCIIEPSDRLPDYSEETMDIICVNSTMEVCSMSKRKDLEGYKVIEVAIGTDRCIFNFQNKNKNFEVSTKNAEKYPTKISINGKEMNEAMDNMTKSALFNYSDMVGNNPETKGIGLYLYYNESNPEKPMRRDVIPDITYLDFYDRGYRSKSLGFMFVPYGATWTGFTDGDIFVEKYEEEIWKHAGNDKTEVVTPGSGKSFISDL